MRTPEPFKDAGWVLGLLVDEPTTHFSEAELTRELNWPPVRIEDALAELARAGLVHRLGEFAFAARAAIRYRELAAHRSAA